MADAEATRTLQELDQLRTELVELAYTLDLRGRPDAADVAMTTSARIRELCDELTASSRQTTFTSPPMKK